MLQHRNLRKGVKHIAWVTFFAVVESIAGAFQRRKKTNAEKITIYYVFIWTDVREIYLVRAKILFTCKYESSNDCFCKQKYERKRRLTLFIYLFRVGETAACQLTFWIAFKRTDTYSSHMRLILLLLPTTKTSPTAFVCASGKKYMYSYVLFSFNINIIYAF